MKRTFDFPENNNGDNAIEISTFFKKAGVNWYNGQSENGGFWVSFSVGKLEKKDGYSMFSHMMFGGFKVRVAEGTRDNKKKCANILSQITQEIAELAFNDHKQLVIDRLKKLPIYELI